MAGQLDNFIKEMNEAMEGTIRTDEFGCRWRFHNGRWEAMCHVKPIPFPVKTDGG